MNKLLAPFQVARSTPGSPGGIVSLGWPHFALILVIIAGILLLAGFVTWPW